MPFTRSEKVKALAIVNVFETSKPFGDYAACVVLNPSYSFFRLYQSPSSIL